MSNEMIDKISKAVEMTISQSRREDPTMSLGKVASDLKLSPEEIRRSAEAFNKSLAVHRLTKNASDGSGGEFPLADAEKAIVFVYGQKTASVMRSVEVPRGDFSKVGIRAKAAFEKEASSEKPERAPGYLPHPSEVNNFIRKCASLQEGIRKTLNSEVTQKMLALRASFQKVASEFSRMTEKEARKSAQLIRNGYSDTGSDFVKTLSRMADRHVGELQKTAHAAYFPPTGFFAEVAKIHEISHGLNHARKALDCFEKEAGDSFFQDLAANLAGEAIAQVGGPSKFGDMLKSTPDKKLEEDLDPEFYNKLRELDARRNFAQMFLYDPEIKKFGYGDVRKAYNEVVSELPSAQSNPTVVRNMVLRNLETGGGYDTFQMSQDIGTGKSLAELTAKNRDNSLKQMAALLGKQVRATQGEKK